MIFSDAGRWNGLVRPRMEDVLKGSTGTWWRTGQTIRTHMNLAQFREPSRRSRSSAKFISPVPLNNENEIAFCPTKSLFVWWFKWSRWFEWSELLRYVSIVLIYMQLLVRAGIPLKSNERKKKQAFRYNNMTQQHVFLCLVQMDSVCADALCGLSDNTVTVET